MKYSVIVYSDEDKFGGPPGEEFAHLKWQNDHIVLPVIEVKDTQELRDHLNGLVNIIEENNWQNKGSNSEEEKYNYVEFKERK